jgi:hypothetical protein
MTSAQKTTNMTRDEAFKAMQANGARRSKAWRLFCQRQKALARKADPATGGHLGMVHNWGNQAARDVVARGEGRWKRVQAAFDARYDALLSVMRDSAV